MLHADQINFNPQETQVTKCCEVQWLTPADIQNTAMQQLTWTKSHQHRKRNLIFSSNKTWLTSLKKTKVWIMNKISYNCSLITGMLQLQEKMTLCQSVAMQLGCCNIWHWYWQVSHTCAGWHEVCQNDVSVFSTRHDWAWSRWAPAGTSQDSSWHSSWSVPASLTPGAHQTPQHPWYGVMDMHSYSRDDNGIEEWKGNWQKGVHGHKQQ